MASGQSGNARSHIEDGRYPTCAACTSRHQNATRGLWFHVLRPPNSVSCGNVSLCPEEKVIECEKSLAIAHACFCQSHGTNATSPLDDFGERRAGLMGREWEEDPVESIGIWVNCNQGLFADVFCRVCDESILAQC